MNFNLMKRLCFTAALLPSVIIAQTQTNRLYVDVSQSLAEVQPTIYGIFFEAPEIISLVSSEIKIKRNEVKVEELPGQSLNVIKVKM